MEGGSRGTYTRISGSNYLNNWSAESRPDAVTMDPWEVVMPTYTGECLNFGKDDRFLGIA